MKQLLLSLLGTLLGVLLALVIYDHFIVQPREEKRAEAAKLDLSGAAKQAQHITATLDASVKRSVDSARDAFQAQASDQQKRGMVADALAQTQLYKVALTESFMANGKWPAHAAQAGLPQNSAKAGGAIRNIAIGEKGVVTVTFDENFAQGARFQLIPRADPQTFQVSWRCVTSGDADLKRYLPACTQG